MNKFYLIFAVLLFNSTLPAQIRQNPSRSISPLPLPEKLMQKHLHTTKTLISIAPYVISSKEEARVYIDEDHLFAHNKRTYVLLDENQSLEIPLLCQDEQGYFMSTSYTELANKLFVCVCNKCGFRWYGGVLTYCCKQCGSRDFHLELDKG